jgi:hypothetical protein
VEIQDDWGVDVPDTAIAELLLYAKQHGLSPEDALVRLAATSLDMRQLGRRLGADALSKPPASR